MHSPGDSEPVGSGEHCPVVALQLYMTGVGAGVGTGAGVGHGCALQASSAGGCAVDASPLHMAGGVGIDVGGPGGPGASNGVTHGTARVRVPFPHVAEQLPHAPGCQAYAIALALLSPDMAGENPPENRAAFPPLGSLAAGKFGGWKVHPSVAAPFCSVYPPNVHVA